MGRVDLGQGGSGGFAAADCRAQLALILTSTDFDATDRERRFLSYVVEETLAGRGDRIKAYSVAIEVFGRDASFDPQSDPIVRIEAGQLRRALERYYLLSGSADPIVITIPKGGYVPVFSKSTRLDVAVAEPSAPPPPDSTSRIGAGRNASLLAVVAAVVVAGAMLLGLWISIGSNPIAPKTPRLLVRHFEDLTGTQASTAVATGLSEEVIGQLSKFKDIVVVESSDTQPHSSSPRYELAGSVNLSADGFRLRVRFLNRSDGSVLWADTYDGGMNVSELIKVQSEIARRVATTLAQTYGVIFQADASRRMDNPPDDWAAYSCTLSFYAYRAESDLDMLDDVTRCLEEAVARFPTYATAWGLLSQAYIDGMRFHYPYDARGSPQAIDRALVAAERAVELDPFNIRGLQAEMFARYFAKDVDGALAVGKRALSINPNDTELMGEYGYRLALSGNWVEGCPLVAEARERNPGPLAYYETALALCAYFDGDLPQAAMLIKRAGSVAANPNYHAIAAAIFAEAGHAEDAERERIWLEANVPALIKNARQEVELRFLRQENVDFFLGSLKKAGLDIGG